MDGGQPLKEAVRRCATSSVRVFSILIWVFLISATWASRLLMRLGENEGQSYEAIKERISALKTGLSC